MVRSRIPSWILLVTGAALVSPTTAASQAVGTASHIVPQPGAHVRLSLPALPSVRAHRITGTLVALGRDSVRVSPRLGDTATVALESIDRFEISFGQRYALLESVGAGALIGGGFLAVVAAASESGSCSASEFCVLDYSRGDAALIGGVLGAVAGAIIGGIVGAVRTTERWERIAVPVPRSGVSLSGLSVMPPVGRSTTVAVRLRF